MWISKFYGAFVLTRRVVLHAIDATPARCAPDALVTQICTLSTSSNAVFSPSNAGNSISPSFTLASRAAAMARNATGAKASAGRLRVPAATSYALMPGGKGVRALAAAKRRSTLAQRMAPVALICGVAGSSVYVRWWQVPESDCSEDGGKRSQQQCALLTVHCARVWRGGAGVIASVL